MKIVPVVEQATRLETEPDRFRVLVFDPPSPEHREDGSWACSSYDVVSADVEQVLAWAKAQRRDEGKMRVGLVLPSSVSAEPEGSHVIWIAGEDPNNSENWS